MEDRERFFLPFAGGDRLASVRPGKKNAQKACEGVDKQEIPIVRLEGSPDGRQTRMASHSLGGIADQVSLEANSRGAPFHPRSLHSLIRCPAVCGCNEKRVDRGKER